MRRAAIRTGCGDTDTRHADSDLVRLRRAVAGREVRSAVGRDRAKAPELQRELALVRVEVAEPECSCLSARYVAAGLIYNLRPTSLK